MIATSPRSIQQRLSHPCLQIDWGQSWIHAVYVLAGCCFPTGRSSCKHQICVSCKLHVQRYREQLHVLINPHQMQVLPEKQQPWQQTNVILQLLGAAVGTAALARLLLAPFFPAKQQQQQQAQAVEPVLQLPVQRTWQPQLLTARWVWRQKTHNCRPRSASQPQSVVQS